MIAIEVQTKPSALLLYMERGCIHSCRGGVRPKRHDVAPLEYSYPARPAQPSHSWLADVSDTPQQAQPW